METPDDQAFNGQIPEDRHRGGPTPAEARVEAYVLNLLGHLRLIDERYRSEEYNAAKGILGIGEDDPYRALSVGAVREEIGESRRAGPEVSAAELARELDERYAPDPADLLPPRRASIDEAVRFLRNPQRVRRLLGLLGLARDEQLFDGAAVRRLARRTRVDASALEGGAGGPGGASSTVGVAYVVADAIEQLGRRNPRLDALDLLAGRCVGGVARSHARRSGETVGEILYREIVSPEKDAIHGAYRDAVEFAFGAVESPLPVDGEGGGGQLVSYARLDRLLRRIRDAMLKVAKDNLTKCAELVPDSREVLDLRLAVAIDLDREFRSAVRLLVGEETPESPQELLAALLSHSDATVESWKLPGEAFEWQRDDAVGDVGELDVETEEGRDGTWTASIRTESGRPVVRIRGLTLERAERLRQGFPGDIGTLDDGRTLRERILKARVPPLIDQGARALTMRLGTEEGDTVGTLVARVLELRGPRVLSPGDEDGPPAPLSLADALGRPGSGSGSLPDGEHAFAIPTTLGDLVASLDAPDAPDAPD